MGILRLALALAVLLSHIPGATIHFMGGGLAVQGFFIVSGFYMSLVLSGKYTDPRLFYSNRLFRLFPSYFAVLVLATIGLFGAHASATATSDMLLQQLHHPVTAVVLVVENLALIGQHFLFWFTVSPDGSFVFNPTGALPSEAAPVAWQYLLVPQAWSLSIELTFYALAPFLARQKTRFLVLLALASVCLRLAGFWLPVDYTLWQGRLFPTACFLFVLGMLGHRALPYVAKVNRRYGWVALGILIFVVTLLPSFGLTVEASRWLLYATIGIGIPVVFHGCRSLAFDRWLGDLSYPIYLTHLGVIGLVVTFGSPHATAIAIGATLAMSILLLQTIDRPIDRWRQERICGSAMARKQERPATLPSVPTRATDGR